MFIGPGNLNGARYIRTEVAQPVNSTMRQRKPAIIPPFSFVGELEAGFSGIWYPTDSIELLQASVTSTGNGELNAELTVFREEPLTNNPLPIVSFELGPDSKKLVTSFDGAFVTPYDKIFVASYTDSLHTGVVIQMTGELMS